MRAPRWLLSAPLQPMWRGLERAVGGWYEAIATTTTTTTTMKIAFFLLLLASTAASAARVLQHGVAVGLGSPCATDSDCIVAHAVCWPLEGNARRTGRCACEFGETWDASTATCADPAALGRTLVDVTFDLGAHLWFTETYGHPGLTRAPQPAPRVWTCDAVARLCWAQTANGAVQYTSALVAGNWWIINHGVALGERHVPLADLLWRCAPSSGRRFRRLLDNGAATSARDRAMRPPEEHCGACDRTWCSEHGHCANAATFACSCDAGWQGERCETPSVVVAPPLLLSSECAIDADCGANAECWWRASSSSSASSFELARGCVCPPGYIPSSPTGTACVVSLDVATIVGASVADDEIADVSYSPTKPHAVWWTKTGVRHVAWVQDPPSATRAAWRVRASADARAFACVAPADFFVHRAFMNRSDAHCAGPLAVCGQGVLASATEPTTGLCACTSAFALRNNRCDGCVSSRTGPSCALPAATCGALHCNARGSCAGGALATLAALPFAHALNAEQHGNATAPEHCACGEERSFVACRNQTHCAVLEKGADNAVNLVMPGTTTRVVAHFGLVAEPRAADAPACLCANGAGGVSCELNATACAVSHCGDAADGHGACIQTAFGTECACARQDGELSWFGATCRESPSACRARRCNGAGRCTHQQQGCACDAFRTGASCETVVCANGGTLAEDGQSCTCASRDFEGTYCERWVCNQDSHLSADGERCVCAGLWQRSAATGNCTVHPCGVGRPTPTTCACPPGADTAPMEPFCRLRCPSGAHSPDGGDGTCVLRTAAATTPPTSDTSGATATRASLSFFAWVVTLSMPSLAVASLFIETITNGARAGFLPSF